MFLPTARASGLDDELLLIVLTAEMNRRYTPQMILEWFFNTAYYGKDAYGIEAAAQIYLGKSAADLSLDEIALLAAIPTAPQFNPRDNETAARGRQTDLLRQLLRQGQITQVEFDSAMNRFTPLRADLIQPPLIAPDFALYARAQAEELLTQQGLDGAKLLSRGNLRITTTLDLDLYYQADCTLRAHLAQLQGGNPAATPTLTGATCTATTFLPTVEGVNPSVLPDTGALLLLDVQTGEIKALVGAAHSVNAQPAAMLFPFVYLQGFLSRNFTAASMVLDTPQQFPGTADGLIYTPQNRDRLFRGPLNLREAFVAGLLPPAVYVADTQGMNRVLVAAHRLGINSLDENQQDLALLERGGAVSLLDMTYAYSVFAAHGYMLGVDTEPVLRNYRSRNPVAILKIETADGQVLWAYDETRRQLSRTNILSADLAYLITHILSDNEKRRNVLNVNPDVLNITRPAAVNVAMTGDNTESWAIGYTPQYILGVHLAQAAHTPLTLDGAGLQGAAPVWHALLRYAHERDRLPPAAPVRPENIVEYIVCDTSGMLPAENSQCPTRREIFLREVPPYLTDTHWQTVQVNSQNQLRATANTPASLIVSNVYFVPPDAALDWWRSNRLPLPPTEYDVLSRPQALQAVQILYPAEFEDYVGGTVDIRGSIDTTTTGAIQFFQLSYGQGLNPTQWFVIGERQTQFNQGTSLALWDTRSLDGIYTLQLAVTFADNTLDTDFVQVTVDNTPPTITLAAGEAGQVFRFPADAVIPVLATVNDNLAIQRVEFYHNGVLLGIDEQWPYGFEFQLERTGIEIFRAAAFDQVGNQSEAEIQVEVIRSGG
jgi:membrane peptidoglycan carboxypeptidase